MFYPSGMKIAYFILFHSFFYLANGWKWLEMTGNDWKWYFGRLFSCPCQ